MKCIGFGRYEGRCENEAMDGRYWCKRCEELRIKHLDKRFEEISKMFVGDR